MFVQVVQVHVYIYSVSGCGMIGVVLRCSGCSGRYTLYQVVE